MRHRIITCFLRWGKPGAMRVDNGAGLGTPDQLAPPMLALWLIGIDMIWNKPGCPQQTGRVETMPDTISRWAEVSQGAHYADLQSRLDGGCGPATGAVSCPALAGAESVGAFAALATSRRE